MNENEDYGLTDEIIREGKILEKEIKEEEDEMLAEAQKSEESITEDMRYKRLMCLLDRSKFYADFLLRRMASKKEEEKIRQEKLAKKEAREAKQKENVKIVKTECASPVQTKSGRMRGAKRQSEMLSPTEASNATPRKRVRKANLTETTKLNEIIEEELHKRAANVGDDEEDEDIVAKTIRSEEKLPDLFEGGTMRPYQMDGFRWLVSLYENGMNGILADEMGLGKTVQCISLVAHLMDKGVTGPFLVCAPLSTLPNWMSEFKRFTPRIPTILYHGSYHKRHELLSDIKQKYKIPGIEGVKYFPVIVTSFEVTIKDRKLLEHLQWRYIIVDEGHRLKNFQSTLVRELKKYHSSNRLLLTGTPLQNNLSELWSLLNFLLPEIFDDLNVFTAWFSVEELQSSDGEKKIVELERKENILSTLHQILSPFLLRRLKSDVDLQIPKKKELLVYCPMSKLQETYYRATVDRTIGQLLGLDGVKEEKKEVIEYQANGRPKRKAKKDINYSSMGFEEITEEVKAKSSQKVDEEIDEWIKLSSHFQWELQKPRERSLEARTSNVKMNNPMMQLKKIVNHPFLLRWEVEESGDYVIDESMVSECGKLAVMDQMLKRLIKDGHKVLIFSTLTMMLDILADYLEWRKFKFCRLDGRMNLEDRALQMEDFREDPDIRVFLISTRAGGLGLNLTAADTVIIYDSDWNPQADLQAQDRCHRIGQSRPVIVYRLVTADTIDQRIIDRAGAKRKLEKMVIQKGKFKTGIPGVSSNISTNELIELLKARDHNGEYRQVSGHVFSEEEMNALMDRSDLVEGANEKEVSHLQGVFKRVDTPTLIKTETE